MTNSISNRILIVDDVPANLKMLSDLLEPEGYHILVAPNGEICLKVAARMQPSLILLDVVMPGIGGFETCQKLKENSATADIPVIFVTARGEIGSIVKGFHVGGVDYITKPFEEEIVLARVDTHLQNAQLTKALIEKNRELQEEMDKRQRAENALQTADEQLSLISQREAERWGIVGFIGQSETVRKILGDVRRLQETGTTSVLITGESGTGKELIARAVHSGGPRAKRPFIAINCPAVPADLAESLFFGHVRGSFTGATTDRKGYFELAHGGTLFLDEIGEMPLQLQAKLLRVLEDGCFIPVGGTHEKHVDVRILAATNVDLQAKIQGGVFREDLYFRLAGFTVHVPPLRERPSDIPLLADHFLQMFATEMGVEAPALTKEALEALRDYHFPGNVRELKNIIERALIESEGGKIQIEDLRFTHPRASAPTSTSPADSSPEALASTLPLNLKEAEAILIQRALEQTGSSMTEAARLLGIGRKTLYRKLHDKT
jgi:DNA-binding NtrC family response regulator